MFQKMTNRERTLALLVLGLGPLLLLFWGGTSLFRKYSFNRSQLTSLSQQIADEELKQEEAEMAMERRYFYRDLALPSDPTQAGIRYEAWLDNLLKEQAGLQGVALEPLRPKTLQYGKGNKFSEVGRQYAWKITATGNLEQLTKMLRGFESLKMNHRILAMTITPRTVGGTGSDARVRTGLLKIEAEIQALTLVDAEADRDFMDQVWAENAASLEKAKGILTRNIFGPANNPPRITSSGSKAAETGEPIEFDVTADDPEGAEGLKFELVESNVAGAQLTPADSPGKANFVAPALPEGRYTAKVRVTDAGYPPKSSEKDLSITVRAPRVVEAEPPPPKKPEFKHTQATRITAITRDANGDETCWVHVQTTNERYRPRVGDSFDVDQLKWTVRSISRKDRTVVFAVENRLVTVAVGSTLDKPVATETLVSETGGAGEVAGAGNAGGAATEGPSTGSGAGQPVSGQSTGDDDPPEPDQTRTSPGDAD